MNDDFEVTRNEEATMEYFLEQHIKDKINEFCNKEFMESVFSCGISMAVKHYFEEYYTEMVDEAVEKLSEEFQRSLSIDVNVNVYNKSKKEIIND